MEKSTVEGTIKEDFTEEAAIWQVGWYVLEKVALGPRNWGRPISTLKSPKMLAEHTGGTPAQCWARNPGQARSG